MVGSRDKLKREQPNTQEKRMKAIRVASGNRRLFSARVETTTGAVIPEGKIKSWNSSFYAKHKKGEAIENPSKVGLFRGY